MMDQGPNDRVLASDPESKQPGAAAAEPAVYQIERAGTGWDLNRRDLIAALLAALASGRLAEAQVCGMAYAHGNAVTGMVPSSDGQSLITASLDATVKFWSLATGAYYGTVTLPGPVTALALTADGA
jgi:WD40 repeat protein